MADRRQLGYVSSTINTVVSVAGAYGTATGTPAPSAIYSDGGSNWRRIEFTASNNLVITQEGLFDIMIVAGGGGGGAGTGYGGEGGGGGGAGLLQISTLLVPVGTYAVTIGAGGSTGTPATFGGWSGISVLRSQYAGGAGGGQSWQGAVAGPNAGGAAYRGGYGGSAAGVSQQLYGFNSGGSDGAGNNGGGAGMGGAGGTRAAGAGITNTFTGTSVTRAAGGLGGGSSGTFGGSGGANTGTGGAGCISTALGGNGGSGIVIVRWKV